ncbi:MAG: hypothetical protein ABIQ17_01465 [Candidatus Limnocylindrales bacterium]
MSAILAAVFVVVIIGLQALLAPVTESNALAVAASTLAAFALFQPIRRRVQAAVDHRFNRTRYNAERIVGGFGEHLRGETDLRRIHGGVVDTVARSLRPAGVGLWLRGQGE